MGCVSWVGEGLDRGSWVVCCGSWVVGRAWWFVSRESLVSPASYVLSPHVIFFPTD